MDCDDISDAEHEANYAELCRMRKELSEMLMLADQLGRILERQATDWTKATNALRPAYDAETNCVKDTQTVMREAQLSMDRRGWGRVKKRETKEVTDMSEQELSQQINRIQNRIWAIEKTVAGPEERAKLLSELKLNYAMKKELVSQRDQLIKERNCASVANEFGNVGVLTNETRSVEQIRADIEAREAASKRRSFDELQSLGSILQPRTVRY
jgi:hypothetical protein